MNEIFVSYKYKDAMYTRTYFFSKKATKNEIFEKIENMVSRLKATVELHELHD